MPQTLLRLRQVMEKTGLSKASIYRLAKNQGFPKPIQLGVRSVGFVADEIDKWIERRIAQRDKTAAAGAFKGDERSEAQAA